MGRYSRREARPEERRWTIHPIWRGIGCFMMLIIPIMAYAASWTVVRANFQNGWLPVSKDLARPIHLPVLNWSFLTFPIDFNWLIAWLPGMPLFNIDLLVFLAFLLVGFGFYSIIYSFLYRLMTPARNPLDAPEVEQRPYQPRR